MIWSQEKMLLVESKIFYRLAFMDGKLFCYVCNLGWHWTLVSLPFCVCVCLCMYLCLRLSVSVFITLPLCLSLSLYHCLSLSFPLSVLLFSICLSSEHCDMCKCVIFWHIIYHSTIMITVSMSCSYLSTHTTMLCLCVSLEKFFLCKLLFLFYLDPFLSWVIIFAKTYYNKLSFYEDQFHN